MYQAAEIASVESLPAYEVNGATDLSAPRGDYPDKFVFQDDFVFFTDSQDSKYQTHYPYFTVRKHSSLDGINEMVGSPKASLLVPSKEPAVASGTGYSEHDSAGVRYEWSCSASRNNEASINVIGRPLRCETCGEEFTGIYHRGNQGRHNRQPDPNENRYSNWGSTIIQSLWLCGSALSASGVSSTMRHYSGNWTNHDFLPTFSRSMDVACLAGYGLCTAMLQSYDAENEYKDACLIGGVVLGTIAGISAGYDLRESLFQVVPWTLLASVALSRAIHLAKRDTHDCKVVFCEEKS